MKDRVCGYKITAAMLCRDIRLLEADSALALQRSGPLKRIGLLVARIAELSAWVAEMEAQS